MKLRKIIEDSILPAYEKAVEEMPREDHYGWLESRHMDLGICWFSIMNLGIGITREMNLEVGRNCYIGNNISEKANTYEQNRKQLQNRINWMRGFLSKSE